MADRNAAHGRMVGRSAYGSGYSGSSPVIVPSFHVPDLYLLALAKTRFFLHFFCFFLLFFFLSKTWRNVRKRKDSLLRKRKDSSCFPCALLRKRKDSLLRKRKDFRVRALLNSHVFLRNHKDQLLQKCWLLHFRSKKSLEWNPYVFLEYPVHRCLLRIARPI